MNRRRDALRRNRGFGLTRRRGEKDFDRALRNTSFNRRDPGRRPDILYEANDTDDVIAAVKNATALGLKITVVSGGHSWSQNHMREGGALIDLSRLRSIEVDATAMRAMVGPACHSGDLDAELAKQGLFFPVAHAYSVALGGFLLGGGMGWNSRHLGLACESVVGLDIVLADGSLVHASATENSDLYWAARGSGPGFFAVVIRFHLKLVARPKFIGVKLQIFRVSQLEEVFSWASEIANELPDTVEFSIAVTRKAPLIFAHGMEVVIVSFAESRAAARKSIELIEKSAVAKKAVFNSPILRVPLKWIMKFGGGMRYPEGRHWYTDNLWLSRPVAEALPLLNRIVARQPEAPTHIYWMNWPSGRQRPDMAFSLEGHSYLAFYAGFHKNSRAPAEDALWAQESAEALQDFSAGMQLGDENLARRPAQFMAVENLERLNKLRAKYDPDVRFSSYGHLARVI